MELKASHEVTFDQEFSRKELLTMAVMHEYPLLMVDHVRLRRFFNSLNPKFKMISRNTLRCDIMKMFQSKKMTLQELVAHNSSRIVVISDMDNVKSEKRPYGCYFALY